MPPETLTEFQKALLHAPSRYSGFGIRSLEAISPAAYWGGFAAALPILHDHAPPVATRLLQQLEAPEQVDQPEAPHVHELKDIDAELYAGLASLRRRGRISRLAQFWRIQKK